jgi:hypothetical protein
MPGGPEACYRYHRRTWREMSGWERKLWYRQQQSRAFRGLPPLRKP